MTKTFINYLNLFHHVYAADSMVDDGGGGIPGIQKKGLINPVLPPELGQDVTTIGRLIGSLIAILILFGFITALFYLLIGGFGWITSGGDKNKLESSRNKIVHAIMGLLVLVSVWAIMSLVGQFFGITFPDLKFPTLLDVKP